jgi:hypothetical protein
MSKVLFAGKIPGSSPVQTVASIYEGGDDNPLSNPTGHINRIYFDSRFDYLNIVGQTDVTVNFDYQQTTTNCGKKGKDCSLIPRSGTNTFTLHAHGLNYRPAIAVFDLGTSRGVAGNRFIHAVNNTSFRLVWVLIDGIYVYLRERWFVRQTALPAKSVNLRIYYFNKPAN